MQSVRVFGALLCAFVILSGCKQQTHVEVRPRPVRSATVETKAIGEVVVLNGHIQARDEVALAFRLDGRLVERPVSVGDSVKPGQLIAKLNDDVETSAVRSAQADLDVAQAALTQAKSAEGRQRALVAKGYDAPAQYEQVLQQLQTTQATLASAQARLQTAQDRLGYTQLRSDVSGLVMAKGAQPGEVVRAGQMIVEVARQGGRDAVFDVPAVLMRLAPEDPLVEVNLGNDPKVKATGRIREIAPQADPVTRTFQVKIGLIDPPEAMRLGITVTGTVSLHPKPVIAVPAAALFTDDGKPAVWIVDPVALTVSLRDINVDRYDPGVVVVAGGLRDGEIVVTAGVQMLRPGQKIRLLGR